MKKIILSSISMLLVLGLITGCGTKKKIDNKTAIEDNGNAKSDTKVEDVTFSNIKLNYEGSITALEADMLNNTDKTKSFTVEIKLIDNKKEVKKFQQIIENLEPNKKQILTTGIVGDYSYIKQVEFKIMEEK